MLNAKIIELNYHIELHKLHLFYLKILYRLE